MSAKMTTLDLPWNVTEASKPCLSMNPGQKSGEKYLVTQIENTLTQIIVRVFVSLKDKWSEDVNNVKESTDKMILRSITNAMNGAYGGFAHFCVLMWYCLK